MNDRHFLRRTCKDSKLSKKSEEAVCVKILERLLVARLGRLLLVVVFCRSPSSPCAPYVSLR
ncbi:hypothetical protein RvY_16903 [Ramazzottius varieornatus]|uniref:Uncharacterized protein n=1 Tax=Ramazzottius varieornatus TaxID=947166 RepID=A0A1D1W2P3_RAMVA|nr:hypothetical protein RvY_16903 [Ramazzottius varieornatus]